MRSFILLFFLAFFSATLSAEPNSRIIELEMKPLGEPSSRSLPVVRFQVVEDFSGWINQKTQLSSYEQFIKLMVKTYSEAQAVNGIETIWDSRSFEGVKDMLSSDPAIFEQNSNYYENIADSKVLGVVVYGDYEIIFVNHKVSGTDKLRERYYPVYLSNKNRVLSNEISKDVFYQYLINKLQRQLFDRWTN